MDFLSYQKQKNDFLSMPVGYREVAKNEIVAVDESHFSIGNTTIELSPMVDFDKLVNINQSQTQLASSAYGQRGVTSLRNFFGQAATNPNERIVLVGDLKSRTVTRAMGTNKHLITPQTFFDFADFFMDSNNYEPHSVEYRGNGDEVSILMKPTTPEYMAFAKDDEFLANGLCLHWNPVEISLSNYYERLMCANGQVQRIENRMAQVRSVMPEEVGTFLSLGKSNGIVKANIDKMLRHAHLAINTQASVHELGLGARMLSKVGVEQNDIEQIIPFERTKGQYAQAGYNTDANGMSMAMSEFTMWQLFNIITSFATHNNVWSENDIRRTTLMQQGMDLLCRERDIKHYNNIYAV